MTEGAATGLRPFYFITLSLDPTLSWIIIQVELVFGKDMVTDIQTYRRSFEVRLQQDTAEREARREQALNAIKAVVPALIPRYPAIKTVFLFGSILRFGRFQTSSDIDVAIEGGSAEDYFAFWRDLQEALPDWLIDLRDLPPATLFTKRVYEIGEKIYG